MRDPRRAQSAEPKPRGSAGKYIALSNSRPKLENHIMVPKATEQAEDLPAEEGKKDDEEQPASATAPAVSNISMWT